MPRSRKRFAAAGSASTCLIVAFSFSTISLRVSFGTQSPYHSEATKPGRPASSAVGILGEEASRVVPVTAKALMLSLAINAKHFGVPFIVGAPMSTIDFATASGKGIPIEQRAAEEVTSFGARPTAPQGADVFNPAFDVTPAELITAIITERGVARAPYAQSLRELADSK